MLSDIVIKLLLTESCNIPIMRGLPVRWEKNIYTNLDQHQPFCISVILPFTTSVHHSCWRSWKFYNLSRQVIMTALLWCGIWKKTKFIEWKYTHFWILKGLKCVKKHCFRFCLPSGSTKLNRIHTQLLVTRYHCPFHWLICKLEWRHLVSWNFWCTMANSIWCVTVYHGDLYCVLAGVTVQTSTG